MINITLQDNLLQISGDSEFLKDDDHIFTHWDDDNILKAKHSEEDYFYRLRERVGLNEKYEDSCRHKISIHIFRSWFVTKCNRVDSDFGNALAGHDKYMKRYNRFTVPELIALYKKAEPELQIFDRKEKFVTLANDLVSVQTYVNDNIKSSK